MTSDEFKATWAFGGERVMSIMGQPTTWRNTSIPAIVDGLSYSTELRARGAGLVEEFSGSVVYLKSSFVAGVFPIIGDTITIPSASGGKSRSVLIKAIDGQIDLADPFITCLYEPKVKS